MRQARRQRRGTPHFTGDRQAWHRQAAEAERQAQAPPAAGGRRCGGPACVKKGQQVQLLQLPDAPDTSLSLSANSYSPQSLTGSEWRLWRRRRRDGRQRRSGGGRQHVRAS